MMLQLLLHRPEIRTLAVLPAEPKASWTWGMYNTYCNSLRDTFTDAQQQDLWNRGAVEVHSADV